MTFILIPTDGPARVVHEHVTPGRLSDAVGGALPVGLAVSAAQVSFYLRETCATDGSIRNVLAATYAFMLGRKIAPMSGPVALTGVSFARGRNGEAVPSPACLSGADAERCMATLGELWSAINWRDQDVAAGSVGDPAEWAAAVRRVAGLVLAAPFPAGFPYPPSAAPDPADPVAVLFSRLGLTVAPQATTPGRY